MTTVVDPLILAIPMLCVLLAMSVLRLLIHVNSMPHVQAFLQRVPHCTHLRTALVTLTQITAITIVVSQLVLVPRLRAHEEH